MLELIRSKSEVPRTKKVQGSIANSEGVPKADNSARAYENDLRFKILLDMLTKVMMHLYG